MARSKHPLNDLIVLGSKLPWWMSVTLAGFAWWALSTYAATEMVIDPGAPFSHVSGAVLRGAASIGQFVVPMVLLVSAGAQVVRRKHGDRKLNQLATSSVSDPLAALSWQDFESVIGALYRRKGFNVTATETGADGGVDLVLHRGDETVLVQCKHWRTRDVGVAIVRELYGVVSARRASGGVLVTGGRFTQDAQEFAKGTNVELIDGDSLRSQVRLKFGEDVDTVVRTTAPTLPPCPQCGGGMIKRVAKRGVNKGKAFLGCSRYPECRGTRPVSG